MTQQLQYDFTQAPVRNSAFFYPLDLKLDPKEKEQFIEQMVTKNESKFRNSTVGLSNISSVNKYFTKTQAQTEIFVKPLGLKVHRATFFMSAKNVTSGTIHADGINIPGSEGLLLEARFSYYEIAEAPGAIRWWKNLPMTRMFQAADEYNQARVNYQADCTADLRDDKITWDDIPPPDFDTVSSVPSAILRTNIPHHVIQGPGMRVTISFQLIFENGRPEGVWEHIEKNFHLLEPGIRSTCQKPAHV